MDVNHGGAALLIGPLLNHGQPMAYLTGLAVHRASGTYRGEGRIDAKDAFVIVDQTSDAVCGQAATANAMGFVGKAVVIGDAVGQAVVETAEKAVVEVALCR